MAYVPNGKAVPVQYVVAFSAYAFGAPSVNPIPPQESAFYSGLGNLNWSAIPPAAITMAGGQLGSDSIYYKVVPSGAAPMDITPNFDGGQTRMRPAVAGSQSIQPSYNNGYFSFVVWAEPHKAIIYATTNGVTVPIDAFLQPLCACVGEYVEFYLGFDPPLPYLETSAVAHWTLPGKYVNDFWQSLEMSGDFLSGTAYSAVGSTNYFANATLLNSMATSCWFVNNPSGFASVEATLKFADGNSVTVAPAATIMIYRPTVNPIVKFEPYRAAISGGMLSLENGPMSFDVTINSKYPGSFGLTQLVNYFAETIVVPPDVPNIPPLSTHGSYYLDGGEYYDGPKAQDSFCRINDAPGVTLGFEIGLYNGSWKDYVRFTPNGGIPVTLGRIDWNWSATCAGLPFWWHKTSDGVDGPTLYTDDAFPVWLHVKPAGN
jgi:hypothetical protein